MARFRRLVQPAVLCFGTGALVVMVGRPLQTTAPAEPPTAVGRVCIPKSFGPATPAGAVEPIWFLNTGAIAVGPDSNLYSTSPSGGAKGQGTIFRISPAGEVRVLFDFDRTNGNSPQSGLTDGHDGWFYGTTYGGGHFGVGTIFRIRPNDTAPQVLLSFRNGSTVGLLPPCLRCPYSPRQRADIAASYPMAPPVRATNGVLYGVTPYSNNQGFGVLYSMAPPYDSTTFRALCLFDQRMKADSSMAGFVCKQNVSFPLALILGRTGNELYGTTGGGHGAVFRATTSGDMSLLHQFVYTDGSKPYNLMQASDGHLYGTTAAGGDANLGTLYRLNPAGGAFRTMSQFHLGSWIQGLNPVGGLVEAIGQVDATRGPVPYLYGNTKFGGKGGRGILYQIPLDGGPQDLRVVHDFDLYTTGRTSLIAPVLGPKGLLYGLTYQGGATDKGAFYTLNPAVPPPVTTHDASFTGGVLAKNDEGFLLNDPIVEVRVGATASQGTPETTVNNGILVRARCPNSHIVQFVYRERISTLGYRFPGTATPSSGDYPFTTSLDTIHWHTDVPRKKDSATYGQWNAYLDQALGAPHQSGPSIAGFFDKPSFGNLEDPNALEGPYPASGQDSDPNLSETWRLTARQFVICNCQVVREVQWAREVRGKKVYFAHIRVFIPAPDVLQWINSQLTKDGYSPIP